MTEKHYILEFIVRDFDGQGYRTAIREVNARSEEEAISVVKDYYGPLSRVNEIISVREVME